MSGGTFRVGWLVWFQKNLHYWTNHTVHSLTPGDVYSIHGVWPPQESSDHQDITCLVGIPDSYKPSLTTGILGGGSTQSIHTWRNLFRWMCHWRLVLIHNHICNSVTNQCYSSPDLPASFFVENRALWSGISFRGKVVTPNLAFGVAGYLYKE